MSNEVYANNMEVSCKAANGKSICAFPDVCFTPPQTPATPPGVPIPYPNTGMASDTSDGSSTVNISGQEVMLKNKSYFKRSTGDEAGCAPQKGVINSQNMGKVYFVMWSMDVKVEGENVVRNLDMTTHNHGSTANESIPFPYTDAMAMAKEGHPCKEMGEQIKEKCEGKYDYSKKCCNARKCLMVPYDKGKTSCCNGKDKNEDGTPRQLTAHHLLPSHEFIENEARADGPDPASNYDVDKAPCVCVEGPSHHVGTEHGDVGCNYTKEKKKWLADPANKGKVYTLGEGIKVAAQSAQGEIDKPRGAKGCDPACLERQLSLGHSRLKLKGVGKNDPLPRGVKPKRKRSVS